MDITTFDQWVNTLSTALSQAKNIGMSNQQISNSAVALGDYLARNVPPDIPENKVLKALWENSNDEERHAIAGAMVKMIEAHQRHLQ